MTIKFATTTTAKTVSKKRPKSLLAPIPARVRDYLELEHGSQIIWTGEQNENGEKIVKIRKGEKI